MKKFGLFITLSITGLLLIWWITNWVNAENNYSEEFQKAYDFAYKNGITTMDSIDKANMNGYITRAEMAKMISNYAKNILWKAPDTTKACLFLNSNVSADLVQYMTESCQLWLMWQWITDFRPNDYVTRAEFWTVLSRMLYWTPDWEDVYYSSHLYRLKARWIITNDDPNLQEVRWYVMLMLMRSDNLNEAEYLSCVELYDPVCWEDWKVYSNWCFLNAAGVKPGYNFWVTENNTCEELTNKTIQWKYFLVWINDLHEINYDEYDSYISLNITDKDIYATFCNSISAPDYSISWNTISVKEQIQTEMACEWKLLMDAEKEFILNGAQIYLQPDYLTINTTKWASYKFQKVKEPIETHESQWPNFVWIVVDPNFYDDTSIVFVYNPNTSWLPINKWVEIKSVWYKRWDFLQIEFDWKTEGAELWTYAKIWKISSIKSLWNVKDEYFKKRNNIPYELKYSWYQEKPIIDYYVYQWEIDWWVYVKNETWYTYTFNDLWIRISTPLGWRYQFPAADPYNLFVRNWVEIRKTWKDNIPPSWIEYIKIYSKWENESLEDIIKERHLNPWCLLESWVDADWLKGANWIGYYIINSVEDWIYSSTINNVRCFPDDEDDYSVANEAHIQFFEPANDKWRYYKIRFQNYPSIFGKIETL